MRKRAALVAATALALPCLAIASPPLDASPYRLPWSPEIEIELTQDCNDSRYDGHVGNNGWAWDFATPDAKEFPILVARGGTVTHVKMSSDKGCEDASCMDYANFIVIDHGDGTSSVYLHLAPGSLEPSIQCGETVVQGQRLATASHTGFASGPHLHYQVNRNRPGQGPSCECGPDGLACPDDFQAWRSFWSTSAYPSLPIRFAEWEADSCRDRAVVLPASKNERAKTQRSVSRAAPSARGKGADTSKAR